MPTPISKARSGAPAAALERRVPVTSGLSSARAGWAAAAAMVAMNANLRIMNLSFVSRASPIADGRMQAPRQSGSTWNQREEKAEPADRRRKLDRRCRVKAQRGCRTRALFGRIDRAAREPILLQAIDQRPPAEPQAPGGLGLVAGDRSQGPGDHAPLERFDLLAQAERAVGSRLRAGLGRPRRPAGECRKVDLAAAAQRHHARDRVLQLPDVSRPVRALQLEDQAGREAYALHPEALGVAARELGRQRGDVLPVLVQRRNDQL